MASIWSARSPWRTILCASHQSTSLQYVYGWIVASSSMRAWVSGGVWVMRFGENNSPKQSIYSRIHGADGAPLAVERVPYRIALLDGQPVSSSTSVSGALDALAGGKQQRPARQSMRKITSAWPSWRFHRFDGGGVRRCCPGQRRRTAPSRRPRSAATPSRRHQALVQLGHDPFALVIQWRRLQSKEPQRTRWVMS